MWYFYTKVLLLTYPLTVVPLEELGGRAMRSGVRGCWILCTGFLGVGHRQLGICCLVHERNNGYCVRDLLQWTAPTVFEPCSQSINGTGDYHSSSEGNFAVEPSFQDLFACSKYSFSTKRCPEGDGAGVRGGLVTLRIDINGAQDLFNWTGCGRSGWAIATRKKKLHFYRWNSIFLKV